MFLKKILGLFALAFVPACGPQKAAHSTLDGHYEKATATEMKEFDGAQTAIAEFAPTSGVVIALNLLTEHGKEQMAADILASDIDTLWITVPSSFGGSLDDTRFNKLRTILGSEMSKVKLVKQKDSGSITVWARDWAPLGAKTADGSLRLLDFNYYSDRRADDSTPRSMLALLPVDRVSVPVYNEGGNFMNNTRGLCLMSSRVSDANRIAERSDDMVLSPAEIKDYYQRFAGCEETVIFPRIPYEGTGHIDMWAKFLDDDTVIVAELREEIVQLRNYSNTERSKVIRIQSYLEERAAEIAAMGLRVIRMPMPAPVFSREGDVFRSYTNSLTVNGVAITPRYVKPAFEDLAVDGQYLDQPLLAAYESEVAAIYRSLGYTMKWVDSDDLIAQGGAVHCTTMQIAR